MLKYEWYPLVQWPAKVRKVDAYIFWTLILYSQKSGFTKFLQQQYFVSLLALFVIWRNLI